MGFRKSSLAVLVGAMALAFVGAVPVRAEDGPHQTLMKRYWQDYQSASNGFHPADIAGTFKKGANNFILFSQKADAIVAGAAKGEYKSVQELQDDANTLLHWMTLQREVIAANMTDGIRVDAARVMAATEGERPGLEKLEFAQEQADVEFLDDLQVLMTRANVSFAAAAADLARKFGE
jgi:hypothetical protein